MNLDVTFRNLNPRDEIRARGEALYGKLDRFLDPAADGHMIVSIEQHEAIVEVVVSTRGHVAKAEERHADLRTSMDKAFHSVEEQLRRFKDKRTEKRARGREKESGFVVEELTSDEAAALDAGVEI